MNIKLNLSKEWASLTKTNHLCILGSIRNVNDHEPVLKYVSNIKEWSNALKPLDGFFSIIKQTDEMIFAAVDHIRSHPLFYSQANNNFYLSDNAEWIRQQVKDLSMDDYFKAEFQLTGYVTGKNTLFKNVKQLQAGECLLFDKKRSHLSLNRYYLFNHPEDSVLDSNQLRHRLNIIANESIQRTIEYAKGRQIVIPLSGGYDSRLIATLLKANNYKNIVTFTYGDRNSLEAKQSKAVAESLRLKWYFIEYTDVLWKKAWATNDRKQYQIQSSNWCSLPHMQDWLAVRQMKNMGLIEKNAVFVPGHSGDFTAGSHIPKFVFDDFSKKFNLIDVVNRVFEKHYSLSSIKNIKIKKKRFKEQILKTLSGCAVENSIDFANVYERWVWQERQSKFICNSVYVYDFFGYDWWLPLWDKDFVKFFENLPIQFRNHTWYTEYVQSLYIEHIDIPSHLDILEVKPSGLINKLTKIKFLRNQVSAYRMLSKIYRHYTRSKQTSVLVGESAYEQNVLKKLQKEGYAVNGRTAYFFLKEFSK